MMKKAHLRKLVAAAALALTSVWLFAWSVEGHQTVATIAQQLLTQSGKFAPVQTILGNLTLAQISTCPDELRAFQSSGTAMSAVCKQVFTTPTPPTGTSTWHFIDIPVTITNPTHADVVTACANNCVLTEIDRWGAVLADKTQSNAERLQALSFIVHFIGDVHQPLHSATRGSDAGGNAENVSIDGSTTSLHHAWDANLVSDINSNATSLAAALSPEIAAAQAEAQMTPEGWSLQANQLARTVAYAGIAATGTTTISATYKTNATKVVRTQLARGGVRLAQFIANAMGGGPTPTPTPTPNPSPTPTPNPTPTPAPGTELLGNRGFEAGATNPSPWVVTSTHTPVDVINNSTSEPPHSGTFDAWMNGWGTTDTDTLLQQVSIPSTVSSATLSFWLHVDTAETSTTRIFDSLTVQVRDPTGMVLQTLGTFTNLNKAAGYQQHTFNLNAYIGKTVQIFFHGAEDSQLQTSFVIDDVSLQTGP
jgi:hypothetical protein